MPPPFTIPGYYWDERLQKFFKIEKTGTAPAGAFWSRENAGHAERRQQKHQQQQHQQQQEQQRKRKRRRRQTTTATSQDEHDVEAIADLDVDVDSAARLQRSGLDDCCFFACAAGGPPQRAAGSATVSDGRRFGASAASLAAGVLGGSLTAAGAAPVLEEEEWDWDDEGGDPGAPEVRRLPYWAALQRPKQLATNTVVSCLYVHGGGGDANRLGIVYTNYRSGEDRGDIKGQYIATDENGCIPPSWPTEGRFADYSGFSRTRREELPVPDASAICYHAPTHRMIVTSRQPMWPSGACIHIFTPRARQDPVGTFPAVPWGLGSVRDDLVTICGNDADSVYACAVAPPGASGSLCVVGTHRGLVVLDRERLITQSVSVTMARPPAARFLRQYRTLPLPLPGSPPWWPDSNSRGSSGNGGRSRSRGRGTGGGGGRDAAGRGGLVTSIDYLDNHPSLVVMGTRSPEPWLVDLREPSVSRSHRFGDGVRSGDDDDDGSDGGNSGNGGNSSNAVAHVRSVGGYGVVAAGLRDTMLLYDVRYMKARPATGDSVASRALFRFADYHNEARLIGLGFAVEPSLGLVAAGEEHAGPTRLGGGVAVFSLATGARLATPGLVADEAVAIDGLDTGTRTSISHAAETLVQAYDAAAATVPAPAPSPLPRIAALSFASLPGEGPSLFAGVGPFVHKYSFGRQGEDVL